MLALLPPFGFKFLQCMTIISFVPPMVLWFGCGLQILGGQELYNLLLHKNIQKQHATVDSKLSVHLFSFLFLSRTELLWLCQDDQLCKKYGKSSQ